MSEKCDKCGTDDVVVTRCSWCGGLTDGHARLREENARLTTLVESAREIIGCDFRGDAVDYKRCADWLRRAGEGK